MLNSKQVTKEEQQITVGSSTISINKSSCTSNSIFVRGMKQKHLAFLETCADLGS